MPAHKVERAARHSGEKTEGDPRRSKGPDVAAPQLHQRGHRQQRVNHHHEHADGQDETELGQRLETGGGQRDRGGGRGQGAENDAQSGGFISALHGRVEAAPLGPFLRRAVKEMHHLIVAETRENGDKRQADQIHLAGIEAGDAGGPQNAQAGGQQREEQQRQAGVDDQAEQKAADDGDQRNAANISLNEFVVLLRVDIGACGHGAHSGAAQFRVSLGALNVRMCPLHDLLGILVVHR